MAAEGQDLAARDAPARPPLAVSQAEAARLAGVSASTMSVLLRSGALPGKKVGARWLVRLDVLDAFLKDTESVETEGWR